MNLKISIFLLILILLSGTQQFCETPADISNEEEKTLATLKQVDNYPLYEMYYHGDYEFDSFLETGVQANNSLNPYELIDPWGCTCFSGYFETSENKRLGMGRNFDWYEHPTLILYTNPPDAYSSVSMVDISYLGFDQGDQISSADQELLQAPYYPFDGMNECGITVGLMAVPIADIEHDPQKITIGSLHVVRLILDYAHDLESALSLMQNYNIDFTGGPSLHYFIADSSGSSAVIEFVNNDIQIIRNTKPWQVATNFIICTTNFEGAESSCPRYNRAYQMLEERKGNINDSDAMLILGNVAQARTVWSVVYNTATFEIQVAMGNKFQEIHTFSFK